FCDRPNRDRHSFPTRRSSDLVEEGRVAATLVLGEDDDLGLELGVRGGGARLDDDLTALHLLALDTTQQQTDVVTGLALVEQLAEDRKSTRLNSSHVKISYAVF